jgi:hypothetical protein
MTKVRTLSALVLGVTLLLGMGTLGANGAVTDPRVAVPKSTIIPTEGTPDPDDPNPPPWPWFTLAQVAISVDPVVAVDVTVTWSTRNGSAVAGQDYVAVKSGKVTIPAGKPVGYANVKVLQDDRCEPDETFSVVLTSTSVGHLGNTVSQVVIPDDDCKKG